MSRKVDIKDLEKALKHLREKCGSVDVEIELDINGRILLKTANQDGPVVITIYDAETKKFADITETRRL